MKIVIILLAVSTLMMFASINSQAEETSTVSNANEMSVGFDADFQPAGPVQSNISINCGIDHGFNCCTIGKYEVCDHSHPVRTQ